jgi:ParB family chromosome partitioning protein
MNTEKRKGASRLGRGLDALLSPNTLDHSVKNAINVEDNGNHIDSINNELKKLKLLN